MKRIAAILVLLVSTSAAFSQAVATAGDTIFGDTLQAKYARIYTYDVTDTFTVPKGALKVSLHNHGADTAQVQTNPRDTPAQFPNGAEPMQFCSWEFVGSRRYDYIRLPPIWVDAAGTRVTIVEYR